MWDDATCYTYVETPIGALLIAGTLGVVEVIAFPSGSRARGPSDGWTRDDTAFGQAREELTSYFSGDLTAFTFALALKGTEFQRAVWQALLSIPYGRTATYSELASAIGRPKAVRAAGAANGANPLPIVFPCHRVIGADGSLTGFGGGIETKRYLLTLEGALPGETAQADFFS